MLTQRKIWHAGKAATHPNTRSLTLLAVILAQVFIATVRGVVSSHLPSQIGVAVTRGELVQTHHGLNVPRPYATPRSNIRDA